MFESSSNTCSKVPEHVFEGSPTRVRGVLEHVFENFSNTCSSSQGLHLATDLFGATTNGRHFQLLFNLKRWKRTGLAPDGGASSPPSTCSRSSQHVFEDSRRVPNTWSAKTENTCLPGSEHVVGEDRTHVFLKHKGGTWRRGLKKHKGGIWRRIFRAPDSPRRRSSPRA